MVAPVPRSSIKSTIPVRNTAFQSITLPGQRSVEDDVYLWISIPVLFHPTQKTISNNTGTKAKLRAESHPSSEKVLQGHQLLCSWLPQPHLLIPTPLSLTRPAAPSLPPSPHVSCPLGQPSRSMPDERRPSNACCGRQEQPKEQGLCQAPSFAVGLDISCVYPRADSLHGGLWIQRRWLPSTYKASHPCTALLFCQL